MITLNKKWKKKAAATCCLFQRPFNQAGTESANVKQSEEHPKNAEHCLCDMTSWRDRDVMMQFLWGYCMSQNEEKKEKRNMRHTYSQ